MAYAAIGAGIADIFGTGAAAAATDAGVAAATDLGTAAAVDTGALGAGLTADTLAAGTGLADTFGSGAVGALTAGDTLGTGAALTAADLGAGTAAGTAIDVLTPTAVDGLGTAAAGDFGTFTPAAAGSSILGTIGSGLKTAGQLGGLVSGVNSIIQSQNTAGAIKNAANQNAALVNGLNYTPIDINSLISTAQTSAAQNAANSLKLEQRLTPNVAATRSGLAASVAQQLSLGGQVPEDVANQVRAAANTASANSGALGSGGPVTAGLLGTTALNLINQRQNNAASLLNSNPLPVSGLDPGSIASAQIANTNAQNQFALTKAGLGTNVINSNLQATAAQNAANTSAVNGAANAFTSLGNILAPTQTPVTNGLTNLGNGSYILNTGTPTTSSGFSGQ